MAEGAPRAQGRGRASDWTPYAYLVYLGFVPVEPVLRHASLLEWSLTAAATAAFLALYFYGYSICGRRELWVIAAITAIGAALAPRNVGASAFFIYAAAFIGSAGTPAFGYRFLVGYVALIGLYAWALHLSPFFWIPAVVFSALIGAINVHYAEIGRANESLRLAQDEVKRLATVAERERIARDMHDVLGHTLSLIVLKAELAARLVDRDIGRAADEIREVERIARDSLSELRQAIAGYRAAGIPAELERARATLETAGIRVECDADAVALTPEQEGVLALAIREAVTNVVRHARARSCRLRLRQSGGECVFEIHDDGRSGPFVEGFGLAGMRERVEALGGSIVRDLASGTRLVLTMPART
jgi:two-component system sensor histidine kinase DesK